MKKLFLLSTISLLLSACGSGGGGSTPDSSNKIDTGLNNTTQNNTARQQTAEDNDVPQDPSATASEQADNDVPQILPATTPEQADSDNAETADTKQTAENASQSENAEKNQAANQPDSIGTALILATPDGAKIHLNLAEQGRLSRNTPDGVLKGFNQSASFYGTWVNNSKQLQSTVYQGTLTPVSEIPTSGTATYYGNAVRNDSLTGNIITDGKSRVTVDFGNKTVSGKIEMSGLRRDITLHEGRLNGAQYSGSASVLGNSGGRYEGGLFGANAAETAGVVKFDNNSSLDTAFGGKRY